MTFESLRGSEFEPFAIGGLDALLNAAAKQAPDAPLLVDDAGPSSAAQTARRMEALSAALTSAGLGPGERVLIVAGAQSCALVALAGALHARLSPVVVPCGAGPVELAAQVRAAGAVGLIGPSVYGALALGEIYLSTAALSDALRLVAAQGPEPVDGALDVSFAALDAAPRRGPQTVAEAPSIGTFETGRTPPRLVLHRQAGLLADALALVEQAHINPSRRIVCALPPSSRAGLVGGPFAALIGASSICWHGPFAASAFLAALDAEPGAHVVVPAALSSAFRDAALAAGVGSLILVSRHDDPEAFTPPETLVCERPIVDLYAFGEETVLSRRRVAGVAQLPERVDDRSEVGPLGAELNRARAASLAHGERT